MSAYSCLNTPLYNIMPYLYLYSLDLCNCCTIVSIDVSSATSQQIDDADVAQLVEMEVLENVTGGATLVNNVITVPMNGTYCIECSVQLENEVTSTNETISVWLRKNDVDVDATAMLEQVDDSNNKSSITTHRVLELVKDDEITVMMVGSADNLGLGIEAIVASGEQPAVPSVKFNLHRVR